MSPSQVPEKYLAFEPSVEASRQMMLERAGEKTYSLAQTARAYLTLNEYNLHSKRKGKAYCQEH